MRFFDFAGSLPAGQDEGPYLVEHSFSDAVPGWIDGVWHGRRESERIISVDGTPEGISMRASMLAEESDALSGDPNTIVCSHYVQGTAVRIPAKAKDYQVILELMGSDADQQLLAVVNGIACARFSLAAHARRRIGFTAILDLRCLELFFVPADGREDGSEWSEVTLRSMELREVSHEAALEPRIFLLGDSIVQTYFDNERPQSGWGEWLYRYLYQDGVAEIMHDDANDVVQSRIFRGAGPTIYNKALGGRSFKSYRNERRLEKVLSLIRPGDAALIQFGTNDASKTRPMRYIPSEEYEAWIDRYVLALKDRGAQPILVTPTPPYRPHAAGRTTVATDVYANITRSYAAEHGVALIDLRRLAEDMLASLPDENRAACYLRVDPFQYASHPDGVKDFVHLSMYGARACARMVAHELADILPWACFHDDGHDAVPEPPARLSAIAERRPVGQTVLLQWDAACDDVYFSIEKCNAATGRRYARYLSGKPEFLDWPLPGQSRCILYVVRAWNGGQVSAPALVEMQLPSDDDCATDLG